MTVTNQVIQILDDILQLGGISKQLTNGSALLGARPEFNSMTVVSMLTALEDAYDFYVEDDEIDASTFGTISALVDFVKQKLND